MPVVIMAKTVIIFQILELNNTVWHKTMYDTMSY